MIKSAENGGIQEAKDETGAVIISETMLKKSCSKCEANVLSKKKCMSM